MTVPAGVEREVVDVDLAAEVPCQVSTCTSGRPAAWRAVVAHEADGRRCEVTLTCDECRARTLRRIAAEREAVLRAGARPRNVCTPHNTRAMLIWSPL